VDDLRFQVVIGVLLPFIGCFGLLGDALSAFVFSRRSMQSSVKHLVKHPFF
jgi:hypothetical protein